ncbi:MAG: HAMP domain-containing histidine kinase [Oscillospiraceae bacterium]|jgi:signal transduction histidine kinase
MRSAYSRQFALVAGLILSSFLLLGASFATLSYRYTMDAQMNTLEDTAEFIGEFTANYRAQGMDIRSEGFRAYIFSLAKISKAHVLLCETSGEIVYSADGQGKGTLNDLVGQRLPAVVTQRVLGEGEYHRHGNLGGVYSESRYIAGVPIVIHTSGKDNTIGMAFVSTASDDLTQLWRQLSGIFVVAAVAVGMVAFVFTSVTTKRQTRPLKEMAETVREFGHGDFDKRMSPTQTGRPDEMGELARAFNAMADSLAKAEAQRSEFIANVSHELKTPMTTISGFADGILDGTVPPEREAAALETISSETKRLARLVRRMLDLSRLQSGEGITAQEQFDAVELTARALVSLEGKISAKGLDVVVDLPEEPVLVWGEPDAITQVCYNLLDNAIKFAHEGGHLWVSIRREGAKALVTVKDEGATIPPEELDSIFDRFHKSDKSRSMDRDGVGLGLYIVKTILNEHRENITVESAEGLTTFTFSLTLA